jgi:ribosomal-protein-serine acetyltransferase
MGTPTVIPGLAGPAGDIEVRRWVSSDAAALNAAVDDTRKHLQPWMPWASDPPMSLLEREAQIELWSAEWAAGGDCTYGILMAGQVAGGSGLHRRLGEGGLEIGYWLHHAFTGRGVMTVAVRLITDTAFSMPDIGRVEIHHDRANVRSGAIPRRLGYRRVAEQPRATEAPGEEGIEWRWRTTRGEWMA